jgi:hypothetical protein
VPDISGERKRRFSRICRLKRSRQNDWSPLKGINIKPHVPDISGERKRRFSRICRLKRRLQKICFANPKNLPRYSPLELRKNSHLITEKYASNLIS